MVVAGVQFGPGPAVAAAVGPVGFLEGRRNLGDLELYGLLLLWKRLLLLLLRRM